jgi:hypothetical protein
MQAKQLWAVLVAVVVEHPLAAGAAADIRAAAEDMRPQVQPQTGAEEVDHI